MRNIHICLFLLSFNLLISGQEKDTAIINQFPDLFYEYKIAELNGQTPLNLEFNDQVKEYITLYTNQRREQVSEFIGLAEYYFPIFEEYLDKYELPLELKYLPIVESALDPRARSLTGALGLWQFKLNSAKMFDLQITSYIDERCDPYKSTDAACRYLRYLFNIFNDWNLAIAAYNSGPGVIQNCVDRANVKNNFWDLYEYLPEQTRNYLPAFIAVNYIMNYYNEHNIHPKKPQISFFEIDTIHVTNPISFKQISEIIDLPVETRQFLNPTYKLDYIPANGHSMILVLSGNYHQLFIQNENKIYSNANSLYDYKENLNFEKNNKKDKKIIHTVNKGEFLHKIALRYHCSIDDIMNWNNLNGHILYEGQQLEIWVNSDNF